MKYHRLLLLTAICLLSVISCNDWLELLPPDGLVRDEYWKSKEDLEATLMGAYLRFAELDERLFYYGELRADMITDGQYTNYDHRQIMDGNIIPTNYLCRWNDFYRVINYCNNVLKYAPIINETDKTFTEYQMRGFESEAIFLRSLAYFYLVRIFKDIPLVLEPSEEDDVNFYLPKSSDTTVLRVIKDDLERSRLYVTDEYGSDQENLGRATKGAFLALLADISLWNFEYNECINYINEMEELDYLLMPGGNWFENFYPGNSLEGIFEFQFDENLDQQNSLWYTTHYNWNLITPSTKALEVLDPEDSDEIIRGPGSQNTLNNMIWKYCGSAGDAKTWRPTGEQLSANWIIYRYADVLLMKAEALSQTGQYDEALEIINRIRTRARVAPLELSLTPEAFEDAIMAERANELAYEGKRWFDLLRLGRRNNFSRKIKLIEIIIEKVPSNQKRVLASKLTNPLSWYMPIHEDELEANKNLEQNPYYQIFNTD